MANELRMPQTQREQAYAAVAILALLGAGAYWYLVYNPKIIEHAEIEAKVSSLDSYNQRARTEMASGTVEELRAQTAAAAENLRQVYQLVPVSNEVPELLEQISTAARRAGLDIGPVDVLGQEEGREFVAFKYRLSISGPFHSVAAFLTNVGSLRRIVSPMNVTMNALAPQTGRPRAAGPVPTVNATFEVHTYVAKVAPPAQGGP
jgi:type IV pilus assembly protein PilO